MSKKLRLREREGTEYQDTIRRLKSENYELRRMNEKLVQENEYQEQLLESILSSAREKVGDEELDEEEEFFVHNQEEIRVGVMPLMRH